jgi:hypothetical protein
MTPARDAIVVFSATVYETVAPPLPAAGDTVSQLLLLVAVHVQPALTESENVPLDPLAKTDTPVGASRYVHDEPEAACMTPTVWPPIVSVAVR